MVRKEAPGVAVAAVDKSDYAHKPSPFGWLLFMLALWTGFGSSDVLAAVLPEERIDIMYTYEINEFNGRVNYQLNLKDVKAAGIPD